MWRDALADYASLIRPTKKLRSNLRGFLFIRQDAEVRGFFRRSHKLRVGERALHQQCFKLGGRGRHQRHLSLSRHSLRWALRSGPLVRVLLDSPARGNKIASIEWPNMEQA